MLPSDSRSYLQRFGLRCALVYWVLYFFPAPLNALPIARLTHALEVAWDTLWQPAVAGLGRYIFGITQPISFEPSASADRTCDYLRVALFAAIALLTAFVWSLRESTAERERGLFKALHLYVRYALAFQMLIYGIVKVFPVQFETPGPELLATSLGDTAPTDLLWAFIGASPVYQFFGGAAEMVGGALLLWPRGAMLGALIISAVMSNVVMFNLCYDVSVKQFSSHLLLAAFFVLIPYARSLLEALLRSPSQLAPNLDERWRRILLTGQVALVLCVVLKLVSGIREEYASGRLRPLRPEHGVWDVEQFDASDALTSWERVVLDHDLFIVFPHRGPQAYYDFDYQPDTGILALKTRDPSAQMLASLHTSLDEHQLTLEGPVDGTNVHVVLRRKSDFTLLTPSFHWIQE